MLSNDSAAGIAVHYSESYLALLDESCKTALPFDETDPQQQNLLIEEMGRRAKSKKQRAARAAAENQAAVGIESSESQQETNCEILPTARSSPSKIPVLQKGFQVSQKGAEKSESSSSASKIPRPLAHLVYLKERQELPTASSTELPSFTASSDFTETDMITGSNKATLPNGLEPLPKCDLSSEMETVTHAEKCDPEHLIVVSEANGTALKLDMTAMLSGLDMSLVGLRFL